MSECPVCGDAYNEPLSGVVGDGQPLDVRDYTRVCFSKREEGRTHQTFIHTEDHEWDGKFLEFADRSDMNDNVAGGNERSHGQCGNCKRRFGLNELHVSYGGLLWCSKTCLAEYVSENDIDPDKVAEGLKVKNEL